MTTINIYTAHGHYRCRFNGAHIALIAVDEHGREHSERWLRHGSDDKLWYDKTHANVMNKLHDLEDALKQLIIQE